MEDISNTQDTIDSQDIIQRIEELEEIIIIYEEELTEWENEEDQSDNNPEDPLDEREELEILKALAKEASGSPDWPYGTTLIHESYFTDYCEELCKDIGELPQNLPWYIANHIDWEGVAEEIKADYIEVDFDCESYFIRA